MTSSGSRVVPSSAAGSRSVRAHLSGWRRSSSHAYACHAGRWLVAVRVVRVLRFPAASNSSVVTVSRWSPRPQWLDLPRQRGPVAGARDQVVGLRLHDGGDRFALGAAVGRVAKADQVAHLMGDEVGPVGQQSR